jgi:ribosome-associated protein
MSRKLKKGYFVRGQFVAEGSELDLELKAELKGTDRASRTDLKRESDALQKLGKDLLTLRADLLNSALPEKLPTPWPRPGASPTSRASAARCSSSAS